MESTMLKVDNLTPMRIAGEVGPGAAQEPPHASLKWL